MANRMHGVFDIPEPFSGLLARGRARQSTTKNGHYLKLQKGYFRDYHELGYYQLLSKRKKKLRNKHRKR